MLIELHREQVGRWYWVTYPTADGHTAARLVVTRMDPSNIAVKQVACTVYGICDYSRCTRYDPETRAEIVTYLWVARKIGFGRGHSLFEAFHFLDDAKEWLLSTVASRLRQSLVIPPKYASPLAVDYKYEAIGC